MYSVFSHIEKSLQMDKIIIIALKNVLSKFKKTEQAEI